MSGWNIFYGLINFAILAGALFLIGRKMVKGIFGRHRDEVAQGLEQSEKAAETARELLQELPQISAEGEAALAQIGREGEEALQRSRERAAEESAAELMELRRSAAGEETRYQRALRREQNAKAAEDICAKAALLLQKPEYAAARRGLAERFVERMERELKLTDGDRMALLEGESLTLQLSAAETPEGALLERLCRALSAAGLPGRRPEVNVNESLIGGLVLQVGDTVYDGSLAGLLERARGQIAAADDGGDDALAALRRELEQVSTEPEVYQTGRVISVSDGICRVSGVSDAMAGELL